MVEFFKIVDDDGFPFFLGTLPHCSGARLHPWLGYFPKKKTLLNSVVSLGFELKDQGRERGESSNFHRPPFLLNRPEKEKGKGGEEGTAKPISSLVKKHPRIALHVECFFLRWRKNQHCLFWKKREKNAFRSLMKFVS